MEYMESKMQERYEAGNALYAELEKVTAERDALAAQVETVKSLFPLNCLVGCDGILHYPVAQYNKVVDALNATTQHHLRQVRADAGRAGYLQGHLDAGGSSGEWDKKHSECHANQYHASILAGEE